MASIFQNALAARQQGYDQVADFRTDQARMRAGNALAMGRPQEAANALYRGGELDAGEIVLQRDEGRQGRQQARQMAVQEQEAAQAKEAAQMRGMALVRAAQALRAVPVGQRAQTLQTRVAPMLGRLGMDTSAFQGLTEDDLSDQGLDLFAGQVQREIEFMNLGQGYGVAADKGTGEVVAEYRAPRIESVSPGETLVEIGGGSSGGMPSPPASGNPDEIIAPLLQMGARVTSAERTPERNAKVGGNPNSYHLASRGALARDLVPPPGVSMDEFANVVRQSLPPRWEAINEGDHIHIEPSTRTASLGGAQTRQGGARVVAQGAPREEYRMLTPAEVQQRGLPEGQYQVSPQGQVTRLPNPAERPPTEGQINSASLAFAAFGGNERMNDLARQGIFKPETVTAQLFREDNGVMRIVARTEQDRLFIQAAKEFLAPILRKDTGAAVTDTELAYYMDTYIPRFEDSPQILWQKARARDTALRRIYGSARRAYDQEYGAPGRWQVLTDPRGKPQSGGRSGEGQRAPSQNSAQKMSDAELRAELGL